MMSAKKCVDCTESTKYASGFWDGRDPSTGEPTGGLLYNCYNDECSLKKRQKAMYDEAEEQKRYSVQENTTNGIDIKVLEEKRKTAKVTIMSMSNALEISPVAYSDYKAERLPMPKELYEKALKIVVTH